MMQRTCIDCGAMYAPSGVRQQRCGSCGAKHNREKNRQYVAEFRDRHRTKEEAERIQRRTWQLDAEKSRAESLFADGMTASAIAQKLGRSHHTVLKPSPDPKPAGGWVYCGGIPSRRSCHTSPQRCPMTNRVACLTRLCPERLLGARA